MKSTEQEKKRAEALNLLELATVSLFEAGIVERKRQALKDAKSDIESVLRLIDDMIAL